MTTDLELLEHCRAYLKGAIATKNQDRIEYIWSLVLTGTKYWAIVWMET